MAIDRNTTINHKTIERNTVIAKSLKLIEQSGKLSKTFKKLLPDVIDLERAEKEVCRSFSSSKVSEKIYDENIIVPLENYLLQQK